MTREPKDKQAARFAADAAEIMRQHGEAAAPVHARHLAALAEADRIRGDAVAEHHGKMAALNEQFAARLEEAARLRSRSSTHPEDIEAACSFYAHMLRGGHALDPDNVRLRILQAEDERERQELQESARQARQAIMGRHITW